MIGAPNSAFVRIGNDANAMGSDPTKTGSSTPSKSWGEWLWGGAVYAGTKVDQAVGVAGVFALTGGTVVDMDQASASKLLTEAGSGYRKGAAVINDALTFGHLDHDRSIKAQEDAKESKDALSQVGYGAGKVGAHAAQVAVAGIALEAAVPALGASAGTAAGAVGTPLMGASAYFKGKAAYYNFKNGDITEGVDNAGGALVDGIFAADSAMNAAKSLSKPGPNPAKEQAAQEATGVSADASEASNVGLGSAEAVAPSSGVVVKPSKFDYFFGRVTSNSHNQARSLQNLKDLETLGIKEAERGQVKLEQIFEEGLQQPEVSRLTTEYGVTITRTVKVGDAGAIDVKYFYPGGDLSATPEITTIIPKIFKK